MNLIKVKCPKAGDRESQFNYDFGGSIAEAVTLFGDSVVFGVYSDQAVIKIQAICRKKMEAEETDMAIQAYLDGYKLGDKRESAVGAVKLDTVETMALRILVKVLARKDGLEKPDKDQAKELRDRAKKMMVEGHKWWGVALKKAEAASADKGFEE